MSTEPIDDDRLRELIRHHKERAIHFEQSSDNGRLAETLAAATPHWELYDLLRELLIARDHVSVRLAPASKKLCDECRCTEFHMVDENGNCRRCGRPS